MDNKAIGLRIEHRRKQLGFTLEFIADEIGVAKSTIMRYERGTIKKIKLPVIEAIARALDVNPAWLCYKSDNMSRDSLNDEKPLSVSAEGLSDIKRDLIDKIMAMDDETVAALNRIADQVLALRDK